LPTGEPLRLPQRRSGSTDVVRWMRYDSLGRRVLNVEPNSSVNFTSDVNADPSSFKAWRYAYNDAGDLVGTSDARGCRANYFYTTHGR
jgi:YD repeat-containing protein